MRKIIREQGTKNPELAGILPHLKGNIGLVFTNGELADVRTKLTGLKIRAGAKAGALAPIDVVVSAGNTKLEPTKTSFFQALSISTRISKGTIEIPTDIKVLTAGQRVTLSQAALLQMLGVKPFEFGLKVIAVYDNGAVSLVGDIESESSEELGVMRAISRAIASVAALSLEIGYPTAASVPFSISTGYRNLLALATETGCAVEPAEVDDGFGGIFGDEEEDEPAAGAAEDPDDMGNLFSVDEDEDQPAASANDEVEEDADMGSLFCLGDDDDDFADAVPVKGAPKKE